MAQWDFTLEDGAVLHVHPGSGHWSQVLNVERGEVVRAVYVFEADMTDLNGSTKGVVVLRNQLHRLRRRTPSVPQTA